MGASRPATPTLASFSRLHILLHLLQLRRLQRALCLTTDHITLRLREEKGKKGLRAGLRNTRQKACSDLPRMGHLLRAYFAGVRTMGPPLACRWALCRGENKPQWTASTISTWLHSAFTIAGHSPPPCFCWSSHSLRKGTASTTYAIKAPLTVIRYAGGWFTNFTVLKSKYIDFTMRPTQAALLFFGYLKKDTLSKGAH